MLLLHGLQFKDLAVFIVGGTKHILLSRSPCLMDVGLMFEFLGQMFKTFQSHEFSEEPFFEAFFCAQESVPGALDVGDHFAFGGHVGGAIGEPQFGLQGVKVGLEFGLLFDPWRLMFPSVFAVFFQLLLHGDQGVSGLTTL